MRAAGIDPLDHFVAHGWREGRRPNPYFDPAWYLAEYPDVREAELNPLLHYVRHGEAERRRPGPHFDPAWYALAEDLPAGTPALRHFLDNRLRRPVAPCAALYAVPHLAAHAGDRRAGRDPVLQHLARGAADAAPPDRRLVAESGLLESNHYLIRSADVHEAGVDPVLHFCTHGWRENRNPNPYFDTAWYRDTNPRVDRLGLNPLVHYLAEGEAAGRRPVVYFDPDWYRREYGIGQGSALAHYLRHRRSQSVSPTPHFDVAWYVARYGEQIGPDRDPFAHFLYAGTYRDVDPSAAFDGREYRRRVLGRRSRNFPQLLQVGRDNPLIHRLRLDYR